jgi:phage portal protein BeeE
MLRTMLSGLILLVLCAAAGSDAVSAPAAQRRVTLKVAILEVNAREAQAYIEQELDSASAWELDSGGLDALRTAVEDGGVSGTVICSLEMTAAEGKTAKDVTKESVPYLVSVGNGTYVLKSFAHSPRSFSVTPTLTEDGIHVKLHLRLSRITGRAPLAGAPGIDAGEPQVAYSQQDTEALLKDGQTALLSASGAIVRGPSDMVCLWLVRATTGE